MAKHILVVLSNAVEGREEEYNDWYTNTHLRDILALPGFVSAQRFKLSDEQLRKKGPHKYLAIYEIDGEDPKKALDALRKAIKEGMNISSALDTDVTSWVFTPITETIVQGD